MLLWEFVSVLTPVSLLPFGIVYIPNGLINAPLEFAYVPFDLFNAPLEFVVFRAIVAVRAVCFLFS